MDIVTSLSFSGSHLPLILSWLNLKLYLVGKYSICTSLSRTFLAIIFLTVSGLRRHLACGSSSSEGGSKASTFFFTIHSPLLFSNVCWKSDSSSGTPCGNVMGSTVTRWDTSRNRRLIAGMFLCTTGWLAWKNPSQIKVLQIEYYL